MTVTQVKAATDANIRQQTADNSISPDNVADQLDAVLDVASIKNVGDDGDFSTKDFHFNSHFHVGDQVGNSVDIPLPVNAGYARFIRIDQPNMQIALCDGNTDSDSAANCGGISRPGNNTGEFRVFCRNATFGGVISAFLTFFVDDSAGNAQERGRIDVNGNWGIGTTTPAALLDLVSTTKGILIPRMTQAQRDAIGSPATGLLVYQTNNTPGFYYYNGSAWTIIGGSSVDYSIRVITYSATPTLDGNVGTNFKITLTGDADLALANLTVGKDYFLTIVEDATGGREITFPANSKAPLGAFSSGTTLATTSTGFAEDDVRVRYDGTDYRIYLDRNIA